MNFTAFLGALSVLTKLSFLIKSPDLIKKLIEIVISGVMFAEIFYKEIPGPDQKNRAIDFISKLYDGLDLEFNFPNEVDTFIKNEFIPKGIDLAVYLLKRFNIMKPLEESLPAYINIPSYKNPPEPPAPPKIRIIKE